MNARSSTVRAGRDLPCIFSSKKLHPENISVEHQSFKSNCRCNLLVIFVINRGQTCVTKPIFLTPASHQDDGSMHKANSLKLLLLLLLLLLILSLLILLLLYYNIIVSILNWGQHPWLTFESLQTLFAFQT